MNTAEQCLPFRLVKDGISDVLPNVSVLNVQRGFQASAVQTLLKIDDVQSKLFSDIKIRRKTQIDRKVAQNGMDRSLEGIQDLPVALQGSKATS